MIALILRNGFKNHCSSSIHNLWQRNSIADSIGAPIFRTQHQHSKPYARLPQPIYKRTKEIEFSVPSILSPFTTSSSGSRIGLVGWYLGMIKSRPIVTKSITSAFVYVAADMSSQTIARSSSDPYDFLRTLRMAGYGMLIIGPSLHFWFNFLSKLLPKRNLITTMKKIVLNQAVYGPIVTSVFFSGNASLQGESVGEVIARLKRDLLPTMISGAMYWPFCDFVTFKFIPVHIQPLASNSFAFLWTVYLTYMASLEKVVTD